MAKSGIHAPLGVKLVFIGLGTVLSEGLKIGAVRKHNTGRPSHRTDRLWCVDPWAGYCRKNCRKSIFSLAYFEIITQKYFLVDWRF